MRRRGQPISRAEELGLRGREQPTVRAEEKGMGGRGQPMHFKG
jgi:hypothetical protein